MKRQDLSLLYLAKRIKGFFLKFLVFLLAFALLFSQYLTLLVRPSYAASQTWSFTNSSNYSFDSDKIEISSGQAQLKIPTDWYSLSWPLRKPITVNNTNNSSDLTNYQVEISITYDSDMQTNFDDLRFTDADGATLLDHWREDYSESSSATFWVEIPSIPGSSSKTIYMYYGNSSADTASNGNDTFEFFDDFESGYYASIFDLFKGKPWERYGSNPILTKSESGWDSLGLRDPKLMIDTNGMLVQENGEYIMYYSGYEYAAPHYNRAIGRATSSNGINWNKYGSNPVLEHGEAEDWDYFGTQLGNVVKKGANDYIMFYSGVGDWNAWGVGIATSTDGINWNKYGSNPVLMNSDFNLGGNDILTGPYALKLSNGNWVMYLYGTHSVDGFNIFGAQSSDGFSWTVLNSGDAVLEYSPGEWDDDNIETPVVMEVSNGNYVMLYHGNDNTYGGQHKLGIATSTDLVNWTKYSENPVMLPASDGEWDDWRVENMFIAKDDIGEDTIRMWYSGTPSGDGEQDSAIGYATSDQNYSNNYFSEWSEVGTVTETTVLDNGNRMASLKGNDTHNSLLVNKTGTFSDFILEAKIKPTVDSNDTCLPYLNFRYTNLNNRYLMILRGESTNDLFLRRKELGTDYINTGYFFDYGVQYYDFKAIFNGIEIDVYLNETHLVDYTDTGSGITSGKIGIYNFRPTDAVYFDDVRIRKYTSPEPSASAGSEVLAFATDNPSIRPIASKSQAFTSLSGFTESTTKNGGEIKYQVSSNAGTTWHWWSGSNWATTTSGYSQANTASEINTHISSFPGNSDFLFRAYLHSNGAQLVQLNSVTLTYESGPSGVAGEAPACGDQPPGVKAPWLYAAIPQSGNEVILYFTPADSPLDKYVLTYGLESGNYIYGAEKAADLGTRTYLIKSLSLKTTYYFKIRAGNGCGVGPWSNELAVTTLGASKIYSFMPREIETGTVDLEVKTKPPTPPGIEEKKEKEPEETYTIKIKVVDAEGKPVKGARVTLYSEPRWGVTDENGEVVFEDVEKGKHRIAIVHDGQVGEQNVELAGAIKEFDFTIEIQPANPFLNPYVILVVSLFLLIAVVLSIWIFRLKKEKKAPANDSFTTSFSIN